MQEMAASPGTTPLRCCLQGGEVVQQSEHPLIVDEATSTVTCIQNKLSDEAFNGEKVRLLNAKNILLADAVGTQGMNQCC